MAEEPEKKEEEKLEVDSTGQAVAYISLDQARVLAMEHARDNQEFYVDILGPTYSGVNLVWELLSQEQNEDYYEIRLSFRPAGRFRGEPGVEHFIIDKTGIVEVQLMGSTLPRARSPSTKLATGARPIDRISTVRTRQRSRRSRLRNGYKKLVILSQLAAHIGMLRRVG